MTIEDSAQFLAQIEREAALQRQIEELKESIAKLAVPNNHREGDFTLKQQILLVEKLGILDKPEINKLPVTKKAQLLSALLNRGEKSVKDHLTYLNKNEPNSDFFCRKEDNINRVQELLKSIGIIKKI